MNEELQAKYDNLRKQLVIELLDFNDEIMRMPALVQEAAELAAAVEDEERQCRHAYDIVQGEFGERIRSETAGRAPSEASITARMPLDEAVQAARYTYDAAKTDSARSSALYNSMRDKSHKMEKVANMILGGYITHSSIHQDNETVAARRQRAEAKQT